ncbi:MAG: protoporphyrinogen oxidase, partial [Chloroflexota bacterium]
DSFLTKLGIVELCRELGLGEELIPTNREHPRSFVVRGQQLHPPTGFYLLAPTSLRALWRSPLLSLGGKLRAGLDLLLPRPAPQREDETLASFVRRRFGREMLARVAQPLAGGIYTADPEHLSLAATQPQFLDMEREFRSVIRALRRRQAKPVSGARYTRFLTLRSGMQALTDRLAGELNDAAGVRLNAPVSAVRTHSGGWEVELAGGERLAADGVCLCVPAHAASRLLAPGSARTAGSSASEQPDMAPAGLLDEIPYSSSATINLGFRRTQVRHALNGMGLVIPDIERRSIIACTFSSVKFAGRAPEERVLLRAFAGGELARGRYAASDAELVAGTLKDLDDLLGLDGEPEVCWVNRCPESMPRYQLGHLARLGELEAALQRLPGLALAGNGYRGVGVPDCVASGFAAADRLLAAAGELSVQL